jgi:hypothetical protein
MCPIAVAAVIALASAAYGDKLVTMNGEALSGTLERIEGGTVVYRAEMAGKMLLPIDEVRSLAVERPALVTLRDGSELRGVPEIAHGKLVVRHADGAEKSIELIDVATLTPEKPQAASTMELTGNTVLSSSAETGMLWRSGHRDYTDLFTRLFLHRIGEASDFTSELFVERADASEFPRWLRGDVRWDLDAGKDVYPFISVYAERDTDKALAFRGDLTVSMAGNILDRPGNRLVAEAGIDAETAVFDSDFLERGDGSSEGLLWWRDYRKADRQQLNVRLALRYRRDLFNGGELTSGLYFQPSLTDLGRLRARSESALTLPFTPRLSLRLNLMLDYEECLEFSELEQWRTSVGASVLWGF